MRSLLVLTEALLANYKTTIAEDERLLDDNVVRMGGERERRAVVVRLDYKRVVQGVTELLAAYSAFLSKAL